MMWLFICFAGSAVLLAAIGTYGVVSFSTAHRMYEMGVRVALGATRSDLFRLVLNMSLRLVVIGLGIGGRGNVDAQELSLRSEHA